MNFYNDLVSWMTAEAIHDLQSRRYLISGLSNEVKHEASFGHEALHQDFKLDALRRLGGRTEILAIGEPGCWLANHSASGVDLLHVDHLCHARLTGQPSVLTLEYGRIMRQQHLDKALCSQ